MRAAALLVVALFTACGADDGEPLLIDELGRELVPASLAREHGVVLLWVEADCPVVRTYAPVIARLHDDLAPRGFSFALVTVDASRPLPLAAAALAERGYALPLLLDHEARLAARYGVSVAAEAALVAADGSLLYRGRIDDTWRALGDRRIDASSHDLRAALEDVLAGRPVALPRTTAVGCALPGGER